MKNMSLLTFLGRFPFVMLCLFTSAKSLHAQWVGTNAPTHVYISCFAVSGTKLLAGCEYGGGVFLTTDTGASWSAVNSGLLNTSVSSLVVSDTNLFAGLWYGGGVSISTNNGTSWTAVNSGLINTWVSSLAVSGTNLFAGTDSGGVFLSTNNGTSWTAVDSGLTSTYVRSLILSEMNLFAGTIDGGIFLSTNNGTNWSKFDSGLTNPSVLTFAVSGSNLFAGTAGGGVFLSINNGTSWSAVGLTGLVVNSLTASGTNLFAGTLYNGIYLSTNNGTSWSAVNSGLEYYYQGAQGPPGITALAISGTNLFAGTITAQGNGYGVWRRPISEMITAVNENRSETPTRFSLSQNFPNPFNPSTTISFSLPSKSFISLKVLDIVGREVATIVSEDMSAGDHSQQWNAGNMSSGIYFYRLQAGSFTATKKLILLK